MITYFTARKYIRNHTYPIIYNCSFFILPLYLVKLKTISNLDTITFLFCAYTYPFQSTTKHNLPGNYLLFCFCLLYIFIL